MHERSRGRGAGRAGAARVQDDIVEVKHPDHRVVHDEVEHDVAEDVGGQESREGSQSEIEGQSQGIHAGYQSHFGCDLLGILAGGA